MSVVTTIDITGLTPGEYRAVLDRMGVETRPEPGIYLHITAPTDFGYRMTSRSGTPRRASRGSPSDAWFPR